jgi:serine/threonine protein kinase
LIIDFYSLHVSKIIHLDIKPDNIIIKLKSNFDLNMLNDITQEELNNLKIIEQVIYIDYGLSCYKICNAGGTLLYMAPEMLKLLGKDDNLSYEFSAKCDIYSLGIVFYYILNMELPINGDYTIYYLYKMLEKNKISSLSSLKYSEEIRTFIDNYDDLIDNMIIFNPKQRFSINKVYRFIKRNNLSIFTPSPSRQRTENSF